MKAVLSGALQVGKATALALGAAVILALVLGLTTAALAAVPGDPFRLGQVNNINVLTSLVGSVNNAMLRIDNNNAGASATALNLEVQAGRPPMKVNATAGKATNLNADKVDGLSANQISRGGTDGDDTFTTITGSPFPPSQVLNDANFTAPQAGAFLVSWSAWKSCTGADVGEVQLFLDGVADNSFFVVPDCDTTDNGFDYGVESFQKLIPVAAGAHNLQIRADDFNGAPNNLSLNDSRLDIVFIPFDATGGTAFSPLSPTTAKAQDDAGPKDGPGTIAE